MALHSFEPWIIRILISKIHLLSRGVQTGPGLSHVAQSSTLHRGTRPGYSQILLPGRSFPIFYQIYQFGGLLSISHHPIQSLSHTMFVVKCCEYCKITTYRMFILLVPVLYASIFRSRQAHANTSQGNKSHDFPFANHLWHLQCNSGQKKR